MATCIFWIYRQRPIDLYPVARAETIRSFGNSAKDTNRHLRQIQFTERCKALYGVQRRIHGSRIRQFDMHEVLLIAECIDDFYVHADFNPTARLPAHKTHPPSCLPHR